MTPQDKLILAQYILETVTLCPYCDNCGQAAKEYFSHVANIEQIEKESGMSTG